MLVIVMVFALVFTDADLKFIFTYRAGEKPARPGADTSGSDAGEGGEGDAPFGEDSLDARIAAIPERFGVSAREAQIMGLFARGHSANWIAEELVISKNTVRSHIRSIYTKLGVHSRRELLDFLATVDVK